MSGPCLCGDPYCPHCGNPYAAKVEAAIEDAAEKLNAECMTAEEIALAVEIGVAAVKAARVLKDAAVKEARANDAEAREMEKLNEAGEQP